MNNKKAKWLAYTVLIGFIPILCRLFAWGIVKNENIDMFSAADFVALGLVLHVSIINEIEFLSDSEKSWKTIQNGFSICFIFLYGLFFFMTLLGDNVINLNALKYCTISLSAVSLFIGYGVFNKLSKNTMQADEEQT